MSDSLRKLIHDARNPLNNISVNAELGKLSLQNLGDKDKAIEVFEKIVNECKRCSEVLDRLAIESSESKREDS